MIAVLPIAATEDAGRLVCRTPLTPVIKSTPQITPIAHRVIQPGSNFRRYGRIVAIVRLPSLAGADCALQLVSPAAFDGFSMGWRGLVNIGRSTDLV